MNNLDFFRQILFCQPDQDRSMWLPLYFVGNGCTTTPIVPPSCGPNIVGFILDSEIGISGPDLLYSIRHELGGGVTLLIRKRKLTITRVIWSLPSLDFATARSVLLWRKSEPWSMIGNLGGEGGNTRLPSLRA